MWAAQRLPSWQTQAWQGAPHNRSVKPRPEPKLSGNDIGHGIPCEHDHFLEDLMESQ